MSEHPDIAALVETGRRAMWRGAGHSHWLEGGVGGRCLPCDEGARGREEIGQVLDALAERIAELERERLDYVERANDQFDRRAEAEAKLAEAEAALTRIRQDDIDRMNVGNREARSLRGETTDA